MVPIPGLALLTVRRGVFISPGRTGSLNELFFGTSNHRRTIAENWVGQMSGRR